jgi:hypothetical protein
LAEVAIAIVRLAIGTSVVTLLTLFLFIVGMALMAAPPAGRSLQRRLISRVTS